jgi:hypothetical protein
MTLEPILNIVTSEFEQIPIQYEYSFDEATKKLVATTIAKKVTLAPLNIAMIAGVVAITLITLLVYRPNVGIVIAAIAISSYAIYSRTFGNYRGIIARLTQLANDNKARESGHTYGVGVGATGIALESASSRTITLYRDIKQLEVRGDLLWISYEFGNVSYVPTGVLPESVVADVNRKIVEAHASA